jgi:hypothetical protein
MTRESGERGHSVAVGHEAERSTAAGRARRQARSRNGASAEQNGGEPAYAPAELERLLGALEAARDGDFRVRLPANAKGVAGDLYRVFNELAERREAFSKEVARVGRAIGREGRLTERAEAPSLTGH